MMDDNMRALFGQGGAHSSAKRGAFVHWTEDDDSVEIRLPLPPGTTKHDVKAVFSPTSLAVSARADGRRLLVVSHLRARIVSDETTWVLEDGDVMTITLAKMPGVASVWGASLSADAESATFSCWLSPAEAAKRLGEPDPSALQRAASASGAGTDWAMVAAAGAVAALVVAMAVLYFSDDS